MILFYSEIYFFYTIKIINGWELRYRLFQIVVLTFLFLLVLIEMNGLFLPYFSYFL